MSTMYMCKLGIALLMIAAPVIKAEFGIRFPADAGHVNVRDLGAVGDGVTDDTMAFQKAVAVNNTLVYIPDGTYIIRDTLRFANGDRRSHRIVLQGQSRDRTVIRLADRTPGFTSKVQPRALINTGRAPAQRFRHGLRNLTIDVGVGNPGAIGLQYMVNNQGGIHDVTIRAGEGSGVIGLDLGYTDENGPMLLNRLRVEGFDVGVDARHAVNSMTFEHLELLGQRVAGMHNRGQVMTLRKLISTQENATVPAVLADGPSMVTLIESQLSATRSGEEPALLLRGRGGAYLREVRAAGYASVMHDNGDGNHVIASEDPRLVREWSSAPVAMNFLSMPRSLRLPILDTPQVPWDDPVNWVSVRRFKPGTVAQKDDKGRAREIEDWGPALQQAIDSGATTVYFPKGSYAFASEVIIRGNVRRIIGMESSIPAPPDMAVVSRWIVDQGASPVVVIERFDSMYARLEIVHRAKRSVVYSSNTGGVLKTEAGAGDLFIEDCCSKMPWPKKMEETHRTLVVGQGTRVFARQWNPETNVGVKIDNNGGDLWVLGVKTEGDTTLLHSDHANARSEFVGGFIYANSGRVKDPLIVIKSGSLSATLGEWSIRNAPFEQVVIETRGGVERTLKHSDVSSREGGFALPLFVARTGDAASALPGPPTRLRAQALGTSSVLLHWDPAAATALVEGYVVETTHDAASATTQVAAPDAVQAVITQGIRPGETHTLRVRAFNSAGTSEPAEITVATPSPQQSGSGTGLRGEYFNGERFETLVADRVDPGVDFSWAAGGPIEGVRADRFSARWAGTIVPRLDEEYTLSADGLGKYDGVRLWIGDQLVIDSIDGRGTRRNGRARLTAGKHYPLLLELRHGQGDAGVRLLWSAPSLPEELVPAAQLYAATESMPGLRLEASSNVLKENEGRTTIRVRRAAGPDQRLRFGLHLSGQARDRIVASASLEAVTLEAGQMSADLELSIPDDKAPSAPSELTIDLAPRPDLVRVGKPLDLQVIDDDTPPPGRGQGLTPLVYANRDLEGTPRPGRRGPVDFDWNDRPPATGIDPTKPYSIRWEGELLPLFDETYVLSVDCTKYGGARVYVDDKLVIDAWERSPERVLTAEVVLQRSRASRLRVEYWNHRSYGSSLRLNWSSERQWREAVPPTQLLGR